MVDNSRLCIVVLTVLSLPLIVEGQWCTGSNTQSRTPSLDSVDYISSIYYPSSYVSNVDCLTTITASAGNQVLFYVETQYLERRYDYLKVYSGTSSNSWIYHSDSNSPPFVGLSSGTTLRAQFHSDYSINYGGFKMQFMSVDRTNLPDCGTVLTATSSYQQHSYVSSSQSSHCTWTFTRSTSGMVIEIEVLLVQGYMTIAEGGSSGARYYYASTRYVGGFNSDVEITGTSGNDFVVQYREVAGATAVIPTASGTSDNSICSTANRISYSGTAQYIESPNYPGQYPDYQYCTMTITADDLDQSVFVWITDYAFATGDYLEIYDGSSHIPFSGLSTGSNITSTGSFLNFIFFTNSIGQNRGFQFTFQSVARDAPTCIQHYEIADNQTATTTVMFFISPNYPSNYDNNVEKYWLIVKPFETDSIVLDFRVFEIEDALDCVYDYVNVYDGACVTDPLLASFCGHNPATFEDDSGIYILIKFYTDSSVTYKGWQLAFYIGAYQDPDASSSTESSTGLKDYIYPVIVIVVIFVVAVILFTYLYYKGRSRVADGQAGSTMKKRTTHDLLTELTSRYGSAESDKKQKIKRKGNRNHPQPNPPGPNVNIIHLGTHSPHPPPGQTDPAYPPPFIGGGAQMPSNVIAPALTEQSNIKPTAPLPDFSNPSMIPPPFKYLTPAEAREAWLHG